MLPDVIKLAVLTVCTGAHEADTANEEDSAQEADVAKDDDSAQEEDTAKDDDTAYEELTTELTPYGPYTLDAVTKDAV